MVCLLSSHSSNSPDLGVWHPPIHTVAPPTSHRRRPQKERRERSRIGSNKAKQQMSKVAIVTKV